MLLCHHCRHEFEPNEGAQKAICPYCRSEVRVPEPAEWVSVVRTANLAEAGFLANELEDGGYNVRVEQHDSFSAVDGSWTSLFLIQVPSDQAQQSADRLRACLTEADTAQPVSLSDEFSGRASPRGTVVWRPLALIIVAGAAILFIGQKMRELRGRQHEPASRSRLLHVLEQIDRPFISVNPGQASNRFRLLFQRQGQVWKLQEDIDGDGHYDRQWHFPDKSLGN